MPNYNGVWSLSTQYQNTTGWPSPPPPLALIFGGVISGGNTNVVEQRLITTLGDASDFGDLSSARKGTNALSSTTRAVTSGGGTGDTNVIEFFSTSAGNATDFGDLTQNQGMSASASNGTRGTFSGGYTGGSTTNVIQFITIASTGDASDFGDLTLARDLLDGGSCSPTRAISVGGYDSGNDARSNVIDYFTIASTGNAQDFGDLTVGRSETSSLSSSTRGVAVGGYKADGNRANVLDYVTIASTGNATDFGDLLSGIGGSSGTSTLIRGLISGAIETDGTALNVMQYITIASTGNAQDFGNLSATKYYLSASSFGHGGLA